MLGVSFVVSLVSPVLFLLLPPPGVSFGSGDISGDDHFKIPPPLRILPPPPPAPTPAPELIGVVDSPTSVVVVVIFEFLRSIDVILCVAVLLLVVVVVGVFTTSFLLFCIIILDCEEGEVNPRETLFDLFDANFCSKYAYVIYIILYT